VSSDLQGSIKEIKVRWNLYGDKSLFAPRYNIAPSQDVPVIVRNKGGATS
jgi:putative SOS response-associated peptidase YedK